MSVAKSETESPIGMVSSEEATRLMVHVVYADLESSKVGDRTSTVDLCHQSMTRCLLVRKASRAWPTLRLRV